MYPDTATQRLLARLAACSDARAWVGARSLDECWPVADRSDWMAWLVEEAGTDDQQWAIEPASAAHDEAIATASAAFAEAIEGAGAAYNEAVVTAWTAYAVATAAAWTAYDEATAVAITAYTEAIATASAAYTAATATARAAFAAALRAIYPTCPIEVPDDLG